MRSAPVVVVWVCACGSPDAPPYFDFESRFVVTENPVTVELLQDPEIPFMDPGYKMTFANTGIQLPTSLRFPAGQAELLQQGQCGFESKAGIAIFPVLTVAAEEGAGAATSMAVTEFAGHVITRVRVDYSFPYACPSQQMLVGTSTFTFFPHGQIVRHDHVTANTVPLNNPLFDCGCGGGGNNAYFFTSFWTFPMAGTVFDDANQAVPLGAPQFPMRDAACVKTPDQGVGIQWVSENRPINGGIRISNNNNTVDVVYDFIDHGGPSTVSAGTVGDVTSYLQLAPFDVDCGAVVDQVRERTLRVDGQQIHRDVNGIYVQQSTVASAIEITAPNGMLPGFVVSLDAGQPKHLVVTNSKPVSGAWYIPDVDSVTGHTLLWFRDGLDPDATITVDPTR
jgi:hypothetical protein